MLDIKYVVRFYKNEKYLYSVHCSPDILDDILRGVDDPDIKTKVIAYKSESEEK